MPNYDSTSRQPFAKGGKVDSKKRTVSSSKTKAFRKAKDRKEDLRFMKIIHEKKFGDRPKLRKKTPLSTVAGYLSTEQRKHGTTQSKTTGVDKRLGAESGGRTGLAHGKRVLEKKHKPYTKSRKVSGETFREAVKDLRTTKGKVHSLRSSRKDAAKRVQKIYDKQRPWFHSEKTLKKHWPKRDKGWGGKHSRKVVHN